MTDGDNFYQMQLQLCALNHIDPSTVPAQLLYKDSSTWHNPEVYPEDYQQIFRQLLYKFHDQYANDINDPDHPIYRVGLTAYPLRRRNRYGHIQANDTDSDSD